MKKAASKRSYKELRLQQLRSFCETARLGSLTAAAESLDLSQPTVWEQVHALERVFGVALIERHAHGSRLTEAGRIVAEIASPVVATVASMERTIHEALGQMVPRVTVAATPRILIQDIPLVISDFERDHPRVQLRLKEMGIDQVVEAVDAGEADLGMGLFSLQHRQHPNLIFEPGYTLNLFVVTPRDHPLARKAQIRPIDLVGYPLVNAADSIPDPVITATLEKLGVFDAQPRRVEAVFNHVIRRYVSLGFGIGLVVGLPGQESAEDLHERLLPFDGLTVSLIWRKGELAHESARDFARIVCSLVPSHAAARRKQKIKASRRPSGPG